MHSDCYVFLSEKIQSAPAVRERIGNVQKVHLNFFGGFRENFVGSDQWWSMSLDLTGQRGNATLDAKVQKVNEVWAVLNATMDGSPINLN
jgi:hypothetical protein